MLNQKLLKEEKLKIILYFFDLFGKLLSTVNRVFILLKYEIKDEYKEYTEEIEASSIYLLLDNISSYCQSIQNYQKKENLQVEIDQKVLSFNKWKICLSKYKGRKIKDDLVINVMQTITKMIELYCTKKVAITCLPDDMELKILEKISEDDKIKDTGLNCGRILKLNNAAQDYAIEFSKIISEYIRTAGDEPIPFTTRPLMKMRTSIFSGPN